MQITATGRVNDILYVLGISECPIYLVDTQEQAVIFDSGITCLGRIYADAIRSVLGDRQPAVLFISHAHWDHCGAAVYLKRAFPAMQIAASPLAVNILKRPNAIELMVRLNREVPVKLAPDPGLDYSRIIDEIFAPPNIDMELQDGDVVRVGVNTVVQVIATPGHTRDHLSFYLPQEKILIAPESGGVMIGSGTIEPEFVADYDSYLASLQRLADLPAEVLCQGHYSVFTGREEVKKFLRRSLEETVGYKNCICELLRREQGEVERVVRLIKAFRYDNVEGDKQEEQSYILNLTAQVRHLAAKFPQPIQD